MDNLNRRGNADRDRISLSPDHEVRNRTRKWYVLVDQLKPAEQKAGSSVVVKFHDALCNLGYIYRVPTSGKNKCFSSI